MPADLARRIAARLARLAAASLAVGAGAIACAAALAAAEEPIPLDPGPHLLIDDHLIAA